MVALRLVLVLVLVLLALSACSNPSTRVFEDGGRTLEFSDAERKDVEKEIARLAKGKDTRDIEGMATYSDAVAKLTAYGSKVEAQLIESLASDPDWAVRMGIIEVLGSIGTRVSVSHLIEAVADPMPLVALHANKLLEGMTNHKIIPGPGEATSADGLPPVPQRGPDDLALDTDERLWAQWHGTNATKLRDLWAAWWKVNRGTAEIK